MNETIIIHVCPNGCEDATFVTTAHVMQDWEVDALGNYIEVATDCLEVTHRPNNANVWTCNCCGAEADMIECSVKEIYVAHDGCAIFATLYVERNIADQLPRVLCLHYGKWSGRAADLRCPA